VEAENDSAFYHFDAYVLRQSPLKTKRNDRGLSLDARRALTDRQQTTTPSLLQSIAHTNLIAIPFP